MKELLMLIVLMGIIVSAVWLFTLLYKGFKGEPKSKKSKFSELSDEEAERLYEELKGKMKNLKRNTVGV